jgi:hypothetical protein
MTDQSYLVTAHSNQEGYNSDCDYCVVDFTPELLEKLAAWKKAFQKVKKALPDVDMWRIGCTSATFVTRKTVEAFLGNKLFEAIEEDSEQLPIKIPNRDDIDLEKLDATVADEVCMGPAGFWFEGVPRHTDGLVISSDYFPWAWFTECSNCGQPRDVHVKGKCLFAPTKYASTTPRIGP